MPPSPHPPTDAGRDGRMETPDRVHVVGFRGAAAQLAATDEHRADEHSANEHGQRRTGPTTMDHPAVLPGERRQPRPGRRRRRFVNRWLLAAAVVATFGTASCSTSPAEQLPAPSVATSTIQDADNEDGARLAPSAPAAPVAVTVAVRYVTVWARPDLTREAWYAGVRASVVAPYARLLADTNPANVPARTVTGPPRVLSSTTAVVVCAVPTDAGPVHVTVVDQDGRWLVATAGPAPS